jgi:hypothetical protein
MKKMNKKFQSISNRALETVTGGSTVYDSNGNLVVLTRFSRYAPITQTA